MPSAEVDVRIRLLGAEQYQSDMAGVERSTTEAGEASAAAGKKAGGGIAKWVKAMAGAAIAYKAFGFIKSAVSDTIKLGTATAGLQRTTGLDAKTASAWVSIAKQRGVTSQTLQRGFLTLGRAGLQASSGIAKARQHVADYQVKLAALRAQHVTSAKQEVARAAKIAQTTIAMRKAALQTGTMAQTLKQLGLSQEVITKAPMEKRIEAVSSALAKIKDPATRAALGQKLLGRSYLSMASVLGKGGGGVQEAIDHMKRYGPVLDEAGVKKALAAKKAQRDLNDSLEKLKTTVGVTLLPAVTKLTGAMTGLFTKLAPVFKLIGEHPGMFVALAAALVLVVKATKLWTWATETWKVATELATGVQWLFNAAVAAWPVLLIIAAFVAIGVGLVVLYKKWGWFHDAVNAVWDGIKTAVVDAWKFIKAHWQTIVAVLVGPIGIAVKLIADHFDAIKGAFKTALNWVIGKWNSISFHLPKVSFLGHSVGGGSIGVPQIPLLAQGGRLQTPGSVIVGDAGPEVLTLPAGAQVQPLSSDVLTIVTQLVVDRRVLAESVGRAVADRKARA